MLALLSFVFVQSYGYSEIKVEYHGQPITFGRHFMCYKKLDYDVNFFYPYNFRIGVGRSSDIAAVKLPDGKQLVARLPEGCGYWGSEQSAENGTSTIPMLILADRPQDPNTLTYFVNADKLENGVAGLKFVSYKTSFRPYPRGFTGLDEWQSSWYPILGSYNRKVDVYYKGTACRVTPLSDLKNVPSEERDDYLISYLENMKESAFVTDDKAWGASGFDYLSRNYGNARHSMGDQKIREYIPMISEKDARILQPEMAGTIILYRTGLDMRENVIYSFSMYGQSYETKYPNVPFYNKESKSLLFCDYFGL